MTFLHVIILDEFQPKNTEFNTLSTFYEYYNESFIIREFYTIDYYLIKYELL